MNWPLGDPWTYNGPTLYQPAVPCYLKLANYHDPFGGAFEAARLTDDKRRARTLRRPPMTTPSATATFTTTLAGSGGKTGIVVPDDVIDQLGAGHRPAVHVDLNGYRYRSTVAVMAGRHMIGVNASVREATGLQAGAAVTVGLAVASTPRQVDMPAELAEALAADDEAAAFFATLSNSLQRYHADAVSGAKTEETRRRRVAKAVALFRAGQKR